MTGRERMLKTLRFEEPDRPPHFEIMFELEKEAFGLEFPDRNAWYDCSRTEKERMIGQCMEIYARIVERYEWDALAVFWPWCDSDGVIAAKQTFGDSILIGSIVGNVQCNVLQDGPREAIRDSALYCLEHASPGGGYIFSTSNTIFPGMPLENYETMLDVFHEFCETMLRSSRERRAIDVQWRL